MKACKVRAFTLIELLVVIAIIALLVSILMPSLAKAKDLAKAAICSANFRQFGNGFTLYSEENQQMWPKPIGTWSNTGNPGHYTDWLCGVGTYLGLPDTKGRPDTQAGYQQWIKDCPSDGLLFDPACKYRLGDWSDSATTAGIFQNTYTISYKDKDWSNWPYPAFSLNPRCTNAQSTALLGDKTPGPYNWYIIDSGAYLANALPAEQTSAKANYYSHLDQMNMLFVDGHVQRDVMLPAPYKQVRGDQQVNVQAGYAWTWAHAPQLLNVKPNVSGLLYWENL